MSNSNDDLISLLKQTMSTWRLTQGEFAKGIGVSQAYASLILKGKRRITPPLREQILKFLRQAVRSENLAKSPDEKLASQISQLWAQHQEEDTKKNRELVDIIDRKLGDAPARTLSNTSLLAAYSYITLHRRVFRNGVAEVDRIGEIASERILAQLNGMQIDQHTPDEIFKELGIYIARLEICFAQGEQRIIALEKKLKEKRQRQ